MACARNCTQLVAHESVRKLVGSVVSPEASIRRENGIEPFDDGGRIRPGTELYGDVVEAVVHVKRSCHGRVVHPDDAEMPAVGPYVRTATHLVHVLGREANSDDAQAVVPSVQHDADGIADLEMIGLGKCLTDNGLLSRIGRRQAPRKHVDPIECRLCPVRYTDQPKRRRILAPGKIGDHVLDDAGLHGADEWDRSDLRGDALRRARHRREHVGKAVIVVVGGSRRIHGVVVALHRHEGHDATGRDGGDRDYLAHP